MLKNVLTTLDIGDVEEFSTVLRCSKHKKKISTESSVLQKQVGRKRHDKDHKLSEQKINFKKYEQKRREKVPSLVLMLYVWLICSMTNF